MLQDTIKVDDTKLVLLHRLQLERLLLSGRVVKLLCPLIDWGSKMELVHHRIFLFTVGNSFDICSSRSNIRIVSFLNQLPCRVFAIFEHDLRSRNTWSMLESDVVEVKEGLIVGAIGESGTFQRDESLWCKTKRGQQHETA